MACELTFLVTSIAVVIFYQGWRNPEWTKCSVHYIDMYLDTFKLGSYHALFWDGLHFGTDVFVVDWFSNKYVPWIPVAKINDKLSFLCRVGSKSITSNPYIHPLSCFSLN